MSNIGSTTRNTALSHGVGDPNQGRNDEQQYQLQGVSVAPARGSAQSRQFSTSSSRYVDQESDQECVRNRVRGLIQKAKEVNPVFEDVIEMWRNAGSETRATILDTQILVPNTALEEQFQRRQIAFFLTKVEEIENKRTEASRRIVQVPSRGVRAEQTLSNLKDQNQVATQLVNNFIRFVSASRTMACLRICDSSDETGIFSTFWTNNRGDFNNSFLLLNNEAVPCRLTIPASGEQAQCTSVVPTIIPSGTKTILNNVITFAPTRVPSRAENREVRRLLREALAVNYGDEKGNLPVWLVKNKKNLRFEALIDSDHPVTIKALADIFDEISNRDATHPQDETFAARYSHIPVSLVSELAAHPDSAASDKAKREESSRHFDKVDEHLISPDKALGRAAWYAAETVVRSAGVVGATLAGVAPKAAAGAAIGGVAGAAITGSAAAITGSSTAGTLLTLGATAIGTIAANEALTRQLNLNDSEHISSYLGGVCGVFLAHAGVGVIAPPAFLLMTLIGGIVGGAVPLAVRELPAAAQRASTLYSPNIALAQVGEALLDWSGISANRALILIQEAQETDRAAIASLNNLFTSFLPIENSVRSDQVQHNFFASSSSASSSAPVHVKKSSSAVTELTSKDIQRILIGQIERRMADRENLITRLQSKITAIKEQDAAAKANSATFRNPYYPRGL